MKASKPYIVGLTGGIASGKSNIARTLVSFGIPVIDADEISHELTKPNGHALPHLRAQFGDDIFLENGELSRSALAAIVFHDDKALSDLNAIMHPMIFAEMKRRLQTLAHEPVVVLEIPLLFETGTQRCCDEVWTAYVPYEEQLRRLMKRKVSREHAVARIDSQMPAKSRNEQSDHIIDTSGTYEQTQAQVESLWQDLKRRLHLV